MNNKKVAVITFYVAAATILTLVACILIGINNGQKEKNPVYIPSVTDTSTEQPLRVETPPINAEAEPDASAGPHDNETETSESETHDVDFYIDISEMTRNPEPEVVGGEIEYGTKD